MELIGAELDAAVARALGIEDEADTTAEPDPMPAIHFPAEGKRYFFRPSSSWIDGGPIIERERIMIEHSNTGYWSAWLPDQNGEYAESPGSRGPTPLIAAMRAFVASKT